PFWDEKTRDPLMYYSELKLDLLQKELGEDYHVMLDMRYHNPSIASALAKMERMKLDSFRVMSLFPQYASATTGSVIDKVMEIMRSWQYFLQISYVSSYCVD